MYILRYALKKKPDIIWEFFPNVGPPPPTPPFWEPLIQNFFLVFILHFRTSGAFLFFKKNHYKGNISKTMLVNLLKVLGIGDPPPLLGKVPK